MLGSAALVPLMMPNLAPECPDPCLWPMQLLLAALPPQPQRHLPQESHGGRAWPCSSTAASLRLHLLPPRHHRDIGHSALAKRRLRGPLRLFSSRIALHPGCGLFGLMRPWHTGSAEKGLALGCLPPSLHFPTPPSLVLLLYPHVPPHPQRNALAPAVDHSVGPRARHPARRGNNCSEPGCSEWARTDGIGLSGVFRSLGHIKGEKREESPWSSRPLGPLIHQAEGMCPPNCSFPLFLDQN